MRKLGLTGGLVVLLVLLAFSWSSAQMDVEKISKKQMMMDQETMSQKPCGGMMSQMGYGAMGQGMMGQMGCGSMGRGMMGPMGCCQMGGGMGMGMHGGMMGHGEGMGCCQKGFFLGLKDELELTDKQVQDLQSIKMEFMKGKFRAEADLKIAQMELKGLMQDDNASLKDIETKMNAVAKLRTDMKLSHIKALRQAKALLTPEQKAKLKKSDDM
jgi:Spy/CpxP family protein refolding chaperone